MVEKRMDWRKLAATIATMGETVVRLEGEVAGLKAEVAELRGLVI